MMALLGDFLIGSSDPMLVFLPPSVSAGANMNTGIAYQERKCNLLGMADSQIAVTKDPPNTHIQKTNRETQ